MKQIFKNIAISIAIFIGIIIFAIGTVAIIKLAPITCMTVSFIMMFICIYNLVKINNKNK